MSIAYSVLQSLRSQSASTWRWQLQQLQQKRFFSKRAHRFPNSLPKPNSKPTPTPKARPPRHDQHSSSPPPNQDSPSSTPPREVNLNPFYEITTSYNNTRLVLRTPDIEAKYSTAIILSTPPNIINSGFSGQLAQTLHSHRRNYNNGFFLHIQSSDTKHISPLATVRRRIRTKVRAAFFNVVEKDKIILGNLHNNEDNGIYHSDGQRHRYVNLVKKLTPEERSKRRVLKGSLIFSLNFPVLQQPMEKLEEQVRMVLENIKHVKPDIVAEQRLKPDRLEKGFRGVRQALLEKAKKMTNFLVDEDL